MTIELRTDSAPAERESPENKKRGFTLTEIAIVLGIMGLILGAIWVAAAAVYNNQRVNQANTAILQILQAVRTLYAQQATMPDVDQTANLVNAGVIPTNLVNGATMKTPWGSPMYVTGTTDLSSVAIILTGMSTTLCVGLVSTVAGSGHDRTLSASSAIANAAQTAATGIAINNANPVYFTQPTPPVPALVWPNGGAPTGTGCTVGSSTNSVAFVFGLQG